MDDYKKILNRHELTIWLDLSTYCNAGCPQCHRTNANGLDKVYWLPLVQWSLSNFQKAFPLSSMANIKKFDMCGTWGDPMMNKDIYEIIEYIALNSNCDILIHTNGSMRDDEFWWNIGVLCGKRLTVQFTIDGINEQQHAMYRQKTSLTKTLSHMLTLSSTKSIVGVYSVIFKHNQNNIHSIAQLSKDHGAVYITFVPSNRFHHDLSWYNTFKFVDDNQQQQILVRSDLKNPLSGPLNNTFIESLKYVVQDSM
jgi:MoaA/NifB/PqqE/SkfB family radical SAM enzyme